MNVRDRRDKREVQSLIPLVALFTLVSPLSRIEYKTTKPFDMFRTTQAMVAGDQIEFNGKRGIASHQFLGKLAAALGQNHGIL